MTLGRDWGRRLGKDAREEGARSRVLRRRRNRPAPLPAGGAPHQIAPRTAPRGRRAWRGERPGPRGISAVGPSAPSGRCRCRGSHQVAGPARCPHLPLLCHALSCKSKCHVCGRQPRETGSVDGGRVCALRHPSTRRRPRRPALGAAARPRHSGPPRRSQAPRHHATSRRRAPRPRTEVAGPGRTSDQTEGRAPCSNTGPQPRKRGAALKPSPRPAANGHPAPWRPGSPV